MHRPDDKALFSEQAEEHSSTIRQRVIATRAIQIQRQGYPNALLEGNKLEQFASLTQPQQLFLQTAMQKLNLSARAVHRIIRVARTLADMEGSEEIKQKHLVETLGYR